MLFDRLASGNHSRPAGLEPQGEASLQKPVDISDLQPSHGARLFPSFGYFDVRRKVWRAIVHGRVFINGKPSLGTRLLLHGLKRALQASPEDIASETFRQRIDGFLTAPGRRRRIVLEIAGRHYRLVRRTRSNGSFYGALSLPPELELDAGPVLPIRMLRSTDDVGTIDPTAGQLFMVPPRGVSIISDIDDTIKLTEATSKQKMLANTFLRPFEVVAGMSQLYQDWRQQGCDFHYVSSSPWQLYEPLAELCESSKFPGGSMHLRYFRVRDEMFKRFRPIRRNTKVGIIVGIFKMLPQRKFVLVGDSGEKDTEIYRFLARRFPTQVSAILIRNLAESPLEGKRLRKLRSLPAEIDVRLFSDPQEIRDVAQEQQARLR
jgi:hypothetical protein